MDETLLDQLNAIANDYHEQHTLAVERADVDSANAYLHKMITIARVIRLVMGVG